MFRILLIMLLLVGNFAVAAESFKSLPKVGNHSFAWMFWDVYDITLYAADGEYDLAKPYALELKYKMKLEGEDIADRSVEEMRMQDAASEVKLAKWHTQMKDIFPNVEDGDVLVGYANADGATVFYYNDKEIGAVRDSEFTRAFFDIWLSEKTTEPKMRKKLLAGK